MGFYSIQVQIESRPITVRMDPNKIFAYFGYAMAGIFSALGIFMLFFFPEELYIPEKFRVMFGVILLLYAFYRVFSIRIKLRQLEDDERE